MGKLADLTKEKLSGLYLNEKKSLWDIAKTYKVSRTAVYKRLKIFAIEQRSKSEARLEAQKQNKLPQKFYAINEEFFSNWSVDMAYVFGLIITDGCVSDSGVISLCINDRSLLEKVKHALRSEHKITLSMHQKRLFCFHFAREKLTADLAKLGVLPRKSLTVNFPQVPDKYMPDFIRGVFDGDGSVFFDRRRINYPLRSKFVSGSYDFISGLQQKLESLGLPKRTIYRQKTKNGWSYMFIFEHKASEKLFKLLYKNTQNGLFLERKYNRFLEGFKGLREADNGKGIGGMGLLAQGTDKQFSHKRASCLYGCFNTDNPALDERNDKT